MSDPQRLSDLEKHLEQIENKYQELLGERAKCLGLSATDIELALEDDGPYKPFPVKYDPLRITYEERVRFDKIITEMRKAVAEEKKEK